MLLQVALLPEPGLAHVALERLLFEVDGLEVLVKEALGARLVAALLAVVGFVLQVKDLYLC